MRGFNFYKTKTSTKLSVLYETKKDIYWSLPAYIDGHNG